MQYLGSGFGGIMQNILLENLTMENVATPFFIRLGIRSRPYKKGQYIQLCLLILNDSQKPEKILVKYEGITQEFLIDWNEWGWALITLLKEYDLNSKVDFEIAPAEQNTHLKIAKVYLVYQNFGYTIEPIPYTCCNSYSGSP